MRAGVVRRHAHDLDGFAFPSGETTFAARHFAERETDSVFQVVIPAQGLLSAAIEKDKGGEIAQERLMPSALTSFRGGTTFMRTKPSIVFSHGIWAYGSGFSADPSATGGGTRSLRNSFGNQDVVRLDVAVADAKTVEVRDSCKGSGVEVEQSLVARHGGRIVATREVGQAWRRGNTPFRSQTTRAGVEPYPSRRSE